MNPEDAAADPVAQIVELFAQIQEIAGVGIEALSGATQGGEAPPPEGAPGGAPEGAPDEAPPA